MRLHFQNLYILGPTPRPTVTKKVSLILFVPFQKNCFLRLMSLINMVEYSMSDNGMLNLP